ncbi:VC1465 family Xer recombination activation factor [Comamonas composti]|uniref:VC1465 family Xer recombination activation factor n=1 Tax=Comamonas composti TaxID=408558 RepID=UPI00146F9B27|nr:VC1465 family Xer recombination activation factor [Comamonas composti]
MDLHACAQFLHVSTRTVHNWESGKHDIPYATYKLLRLLNRMELPGQSWQGWCFYGNKLISPEGRSFEGKDSNWWGLLVLRARMCSEFQEKLRAAEAARRGPACGEASGSFSGLEMSEVPVTLHFSLTSDTDTRSAAAGLTFPVTRQSSLTHENFCLKNGQSDAVNSDLQEAA